MYFSLKNSTCLFERARYAESSQRVSGLPADPFAHSPSSNPLATFALKAQFGRFIVYISVKYLKNHLHDLKITEKYVILKLPNEKQG